MQDPAGHLNLRGAQESTRSTYRKTVLTVWDMSFARIKSNLPLATSLLQSFAFLYPDDIPLDLFLNHARTILGLDEKPSRPMLNDAIAQLRHFSLILRESDKRHPAQNTLTI